MASVTGRCYEFYRSVGMTTMFGNPGSTELPFLCDFPGDLRYVLGLHEASVVNMAVGYALAGDRAALVNLHTAAGVGNAMGAIINAWHCKAPLVVTAGQQVRQMERTEPMLWGRQVEVARPYVKWSYEPHRAVDIPEAIARAYHTALAAPRGPVFVSICMDGLDEECPAVTRRRIDGAPAPDPNAIRRFARGLDDARRIAIVAGEALDDPETWHATIALAERLNAAVFAPPENFRVSFPTGHRLFRGFLPAAIKPVSDKLAGFDALLVLGTRMFLYYPYVPGPFMPGGIKVFYITSDPAEAARAVAGDAAIGCPRAAVRLLLESTREGIARPTPPEGPAPPPAGPGEPTPPAFVYKTLADVAPPGTVVVEESLSSRSIHQRLVPRNEPRSFFCTGNGILGSALPMAVGVKMSRPDRPVACVLGDGAAQYSIQGLWTAAKQKLPIVFLVLDNREYAILKSFADFEETPGVPGLDLGGIDFAGLAAGYGVPCRVAGTGDLADALRDAFAADGPRMVVIRVDPKVPPLLG
jgi:benzoylformate decarboxylase